MDNLSSSAICLSLALLTIGGSCTLQAADTLGGFAIGEESHFERTPMGGIVRIQNDEVTTWSLPGDGEWIAQIKVGATLNGYTPYAITSSGKLYRGNLASHDWTLIGALPESTGKSIPTETFVADVFTPDRLFWSIDRSIYMSVDAGRSWAPMSELPDYVSRLVYALNHELVAISQNGAVLRGSVDRLENASQWSPATEYLPVFQGERVLVLDDGQYLITSSGDSTRAIAYDSKTRHIDRKVFSSKSSLPKERSSDNGTTQNCQFKVNRLDNSTGIWKTDNYWDINSERYFLRFEMVVTKTAETGKACVFFPAFDPHRIDLRTADSSKSLPWGVARTPGHYALVIDASTFSDPIMRAVALHVQNPNDYRGKNGQSIRQNPNDTWALVLQNHPGGGTACEAFQRAPTATPSRLTLTIGVTGANPYCPRTSTSSIACTSDPKSNSRSAGGASTMSVFRPLAQSGMGECRVGDPD